jgi:ParB family chromosome partitioning protein
MSNNKKPALGRGLSALLENAKTDITTKNLSENAPVVNSVSNILIKDIETNPFQPRTNFEENALQELCDSIKQHGIIQPITVRKLGYDKYQLISGERRFRASQMANLTNVPAYIRIADDQEMLEMALVENIQREDLDPIEVSLSYKRLIDECNLTQEQLSEKVGKQRSTVTNYIRLLKLPPDIQLAVRNGSLSMGHARALVNIDTIDKQLFVFKEISAKSLNVRQTEELVRKMYKADKQGAVKPSVKNELPPAYRKIEDNLASHFGTKVRMAHNKKGYGSISIEYYSLEELNKILDAMHVTVS